MGVVRAVTEAGDMHDGRGGVEYYGSRLRCGPVRCGKRLLALSYALRIMGFAVGTFSHRDHFQHYKLNE